MTRTCKVTELEDTNKYMYMWAPPINLRKEIENDAQRNDKGLDHDV